MDVIGLMAGHAIRLGLAELLTRDMALRAVGLGMRAGEREVRIVVIEGLAVQPDDVEVPPLVIGVTGFALDARHRR